MDNSQTPITPGGILVAKVTTAGGTIPVEGASVYIKRFGEEDNEMSDILYTLRTNSQGFTNAVSLPTPPRSASQTPNNGAFPFSQYIMTVKKEGFYSVENIGLPMFDGITSIQPVELLPLTEEDQLSGERPEVTYFENDGYANLRGLDVDQRQPEGDNNES